MVDEQHAQVSASNVTPGVIGLGRKGGNYKSGHQYRPATLGCDPRKHTTAQHSARTGAKRTKWRGSYRYVQATHSPTGGPWLGADLGRFNVFGIRGVCLQSPEQQ